MGGGRKEEEGRQPAGGRRAWPAGDALQAAAASDSITARCRAAAGGRRGPHGDAARLKGCQVPPRRGHAVGMGFSPCSSCCLACADRPLQRWGLRGDSAPCAHPPSHRAAPHPIGVPAVLPHALQLSPSPHPNCIPQSSPPAQHPPAFIPLDAPLQPPPRGGPVFSTGGGGGFARRVAVSLNRVVWGAWGNLGVCAMPPCPGLSPAVGHTLLGVCGLGAPCHLPVPAGCHRPRCAIGVWLMDSGVSSMNFGVRSVGFEVWLMDFGVGSVDELWDLAGGFWGLIHEFWGEICGL